AARRGASRSLRHPRQLSGSRNDPHGAECRGDSFGSAGATCRVPSTQAVGNARRRRTGGAVPGVVQQRVDHRNDRGHFRWRSDEVMMDMHRALLLTHVAAMIGLFSTLTVEGLALRFLRRATTYEQARAWTAAWTLLPAIGAPSILLSLASGISLATTLGLWDFSWAQVAVPTLVIVAVAGGVVAPRRSRVRAALGDNSGPLPDVLRDQ